MPHRFKAPRIAVRLALVGLVVVLAVAGPAQHHAQAQGGLEFEVLLPLAVDRHAGPFPPAPTAIPYTATPTATATASPTATATPLPTATATPPATPTPEGPLWLQYVNHHRALAYLPPVTENETWSDGDWKHSRYMVKNDVISHSETSGRPFYSSEGHEAAQNGNVAIHSRLDLPTEDPIDMWMTGPFHMLGIIDPRLAVSGFGEYHEDIGSFKSGATLDVLRGLLPDAPPGVSFPVRYPEDGESIPNLAYDGGESPDPLTSCPGYAVNTGPPIALQLGTRDVVPNVTRTSFSTGGRELPHCTFDETSYRNPNSNNQRLGRGVLDMRDAIIVLPREPLAAGATYTVRIEVSGQVHEWSFSAGRGRQVAPGFGQQPMPPRAWD